MSHLHPPPERRPGLLSLLLLPGLVACAGGPKKRAVEPYPGAVCARQLPPQAPPQPGKFDAQPLPASAVVVHLKLDTSSLLGDLEGSVPQVVAKGKGIPLSGLGKLAFSIRRGRFSHRLNQNRLEVRLPLFGNAEICKEVPLLGCVGYATCAPQAQALASVELALRPDYALPAPDVQIPITRPCTLTALDVDVTGRIQREANRQARQIRQRISASIPPIQGLAKDLWRALTTRVPVGPDACARVHPDHFVQSPPHQAGGSILLGVGIRGRVVVESPCGPASPPPPLPPPRVDPALKPGVRLTIPLQMSWAKTSEKLSRDLGGKEFIAEGQTYRVTSVRAYARDERGLMLDVGVTGRVCGLVRLTAGLSYNKLADRLDLAAVSPLKAGDPFAKALAAKLEKTGSLALPVRLEGMDQRINLLAEQLLGKETWEADAPHTNVAIGIKPIAVKRLHYSSQGIALRVVAEGEAKVLVK